MLLHPVIDPLHAKFFRGNKNIYIFMSLRHVDMPQVFESLFQEIQKLTYST